MTLKTPTIAALLAVAAPCLSLHAQTWNWGNSFQSSGPDVAKFEAGVLAPLRASQLNQTDYNYALEAVSTRPDPIDADNRFDIGFLSRFDESGTNLWNVMLDPGASAIDLDVSALGGTTDLFFASYDEPTTPNTRAFRLGIFRGSDRSALFAKRFETSAFTPRYIDVFDQDRIGITLDQGAAVESVVFDQDGSPVFNKRYSSPSFSASNGFVTQSLLRAFLPSRDSYLTSVSQTVFSFVGPSITTDVKLMPFFTDLDGAIVSGGSFQFNSNAPQAVPLPSTLSDDAVLYRIQAAADGIFIGGNVEPVTHLVKINENGTLAWAKTIEPAIIQAVFPTPTAIYLAGSRPTPQAVAPALSDGLVVKLDPDTGEVLEQLAFQSIDEFDIVSAVIATNTHVFLNINSFKAFADDPLISKGISTLVKMDLDFENIVARQFLAPHQSSILIPDSPIDDIDQFVFSTSPLSNGTIQAFTLDEDLQPLSDCDLFTPFTPGIGEPVGATNLAVTSSPLSVTASDVVTPSTDTSISISEFTLVIQQICSLTTGLEIKLSDDNNAIILTFPTQEGTEYSLLFSPDLSTAFSVVDSVPGSGSLESFTRPLGNGKGFYKISPQP